MEAITTLPNLAMVKGTNNYLISYNNNSLLSEKVMTGDVIIAKELELVDFSFLISTVCRV